VGLKSLWVFRRGVQAPSPPRLPLRVLPRRRRLWHNGPAMSETRITPNDENVVYEMPPWIADALASELVHAATHYPTGKARAPDEYDRGWLTDAQELMVAADEVRDDRDWEAGL